MHLFPNEDYLNELNAAQRAAVEYNDGPALVIAGAGSGKTRVLVYKILHLIRLGYDPSRLMALTFTNKAAREMRQRIELIIGPAARRLRMGTFHSIFLSILRQHASLLGYSPSFSVYNSSDSKNRIKAIIKQMSLDDKVYKPNAVAGAISRAKNRLISPEAYRANVEYLRLDAKAGLGRLWEIYARYTQELKQSNAMDFDDLLFEINILLRNHPDVLAYWQGQIDYLLIDEYQDTNFAQYMIARQLMQERGNIFVVGDDAQSIYSFRGANLDNILRFRETFAGAKIFKLEQNYRSSQTIVQAAGALIQHNKHQIPKEVFSLGEVGEAIELHEAFSGDMEASWVCKRIDDLRRQTGATYDQFAVLYRTNVQSRTLEQVFRRTGIPFRIYGGRSFFDHKEIMDVVAYMRLVVNPNDEEALLRVINYPRRGIGETTMAKLRQQAFEVGKPLMEVLQELEHYELGISRATQSKLSGFAALITELRGLSESTADFYEGMQLMISRTGIPVDLMSDTSLEGKSRQENIKEMLSGIEEYSRNAQEQGQEPSLEAYLSEIALLTDQDKKEHHTETGVTLMTIHAAKGLEFKHVFIVGLEEMLFPSILSVESEKDLEEERRLFYVAITRAEKTCHLGYARQRFRNGRTENTQPSRFLRELPPALLKRNSASIDTMIEFERSGWRQQRGYGRDQMASELPQHFTSQSFLPPSPTGGKRRHIGRRVAGEDAEPEVSHERIGDLRVGGRVRHRIFGDGQITALEGLGDNAKAIVAFDKVGSKKLLIQFARLEPLD